MKNLILLCTLSFFIACQNAKQPFVELNVDQMLELQANETVCIIDVRTPAEVKEGYIKGTAHFIDFNGNNFEKQLAALPQNEKYVVYCRSGNRSTKALHKMQALGFTNLYELEGGIKAVQQADLIVQ